MEGTCYIFSSTGDFDGFKKPQINENDFVIAADSGYENALRLGIDVNLIVGDFDSLSLDINKISAEKEVYPTAKDYTDTFAAVKKALEKGYKKIEIIGGTAGRPDHLLANIHILKYINENGAFGMLTDAKMSIYYIKDSQIELEFDSKKRTISVFSYGEKAKGVTLKGVKYPLDNATVTNSFPIGVSNEFNGKRATISVENGELIIFNLV